MQLDMQARTFVEHGMANGKLCIVTKEEHAPYERPALTKAYLFPTDKKPARLPGFHTCVGSGGERQTPEWYNEQGIEVLYKDPVTGIDIEKQTLTTNSGKLLKYGSLIMATGCTASSGMRARFCQGVHCCYHIHDEGVMTFKGGDDVLGGQKYLLVSKARHSEAIACWCAVREDITWCGEVSCMPSGGLTLVGRIPCLEGKLGTGKRLLFRRASLGAWCFKLCPRVGHNCVTEDVTRIGGGECHGPPDGVTPDGRHKARVCINEAAEEGSETLEEVLENSGRVQNVADKVLEGSETLENYREFRKKFYSLSQRSGLLSRMRASQISHDMRDFGLQNFRVRKLRDYHDQIFCETFAFPDKIGGNLPGVHYIRDVADADLLITSLEKARKVVVVGGGYIGMEVAAAAVGWKLDTTIIFPENHLLQRLFTPSLAEKYEKLYQENGVKFLKGASIKNLEVGPDGRVAKVKLENGSTIEADTIVIGIGAKPAVSPFEVTVGLNKQVGGIQVDGQFRTSVPGIFAIGDVAAFPLKMYDRLARVEHVDHARRSAQHCVKALLSAQTHTYDYLPYFYSRVFEYEGSPRKVWWQFFGDNVGEIVEIGNFDPKIATFWIDSGKLKGVLLESGSPEEFQLLPKLARSQPIVDKAKLQSASSVEEALQIAQSSL
ncbi:monodehydroascorbate reductase 6 [Actinidia rufa]|uniref:monodehydroascorbate reductase (NADH) n=1 Tax=Actinidia rufa TaxID=165716 RepID=A0A7J0H0D9_9ERIC|nr:monodehydroascorbate reductase 6 [Actinidia rufa]